MQKLLTQELRKNLPKIYTQDGKGNEAKIYAKFFTPDSSLTWYVLEGEPVLDEQGNEVDFEFYGLVDGYEQELCYFTLSNLKSIRGKFGLPVERDLYFKNQIIGDIRR